MTALERLTALAGALADWLVARLGLPVKSIRKDRPS